MKIKLFVAREIQYFELGIFSFNLYVYYLTRGFIASTRAFNLLTRAFNLPTRAFSLPTRAFNLATRAFSVLTREFELVTRGFELVTGVLLFHIYGSSSGSFHKEKCNFSNPVLKTILYLVAFSWINLPLTAKYTSGKLIAK